MSAHRSCLAILGAITFVGAAAGAQQTGAAPKPADTEIWMPVPRVVTAGATDRSPPSDAIRLFDGRNLDEWINTNDRAPAAWTLTDGVVTVNKAVGNIETKRRFRNYQLHIEWRIPARITGTDQGRGNSGVFLASTGEGDEGYELQILDSYRNTTYVNGQSGSIYKQASPLVNANRKPGQWQSYDVIWTAPTFVGDGALKTPALVTVLHNGVVIQSNFALKGATRYIGAPEYARYDSASIKLQSHGDKSPPISFRNIWVRAL